MTKAALRKKVCIKCVNEHDPRGWGFVNPNYDPHNGTGDTLFEYRWRESDDALWGDEETGKRPGKSHPFEAGVVVCPQVLKDEMPGYSYGKHGDLGVVCKAPPPWCPYPNGHLPMARFRDLAEEEDAP